MAPSLPTYTCFYHQSHPFSNWFVRPFTFHGILFQHMEQYMMYAKARLFRDPVVMAEVLQTPDQMAVKRLGRQVKGYTDEVWFAWRDRIVAAGLREKFRQHADLRERLFATTGTILVEASPSDTIWGVGLRATDPRIHQGPSAWRGENRLGFLLTQVRDELMLEFGLTPLPIPPLIRPAPMPSARSRGMRAGR